MYKIYKYINKFNNKVYIGRTNQTLAQRANRNGSGYRHNVKFYTDIQKYLWSSFTPEVLEETETIDKANELERYYIALYNSTDDRLGYNIERGGMSGPSHESTRAIISNNAKERYKDKTKNPMYGRKHNQATLEKQSSVKMGDKNPMFGRKWTERQRSLCGTKGKTLNLSDEHRAELVQKGKWLGNLRRLRAKSILCIEDNTVFDTQTDAASFYGVTVSTLNGHLNGRQHTCKGRHFVYLDDAKSSTTIENAGGIAC